MQQHAGPVLYDRRGHGRSDRPAAGYDLDTMADDLAAVIEHFGLRDITLVAHSAAPTTPLMRWTEDNRDGLDPALIDANFAAVAADVPQWCANFEAAGPYFGASPGSSQGLIDWTIRMIVDTPTRVLLEALKVNTHADMRGELQKIARLHP